MLRMIEESEVMDHGDGLARSGHRNDPRGSKVDVASQKMRRKRILFPKGIAKGFKTRRNMLENGGFFGKSGQIKLLRTDQDKVRISGDVEKRIQEFPCIATRSEPLLAEKAAIDGNSRPGGPPARGQGPRL